MSMQDDSMRVAIVDYGMGNLFSVRRACDHAKIQSIVTAEAIVIEKADALILPGVGAFGDAMGNLKSLDLISPIKDFIAAGKPFMGICLGMQLLFSESEEFGKHKGLDIINGKVLKFPARDRKDSNSKVPQVGWNRISATIESYEQCWNASPLKTLRNGEFMYFVHSYYVKPDSDNEVLAITEYADVTYASGIMKNNIFAFQFHPEISGKQGLEIYKNFKEIISNGGMHGTAEGYSKKV